MTPGPGESGIDAELDRLEAAITRLAGGGAPLGDLVRSYQEAQRLLEDARRRLEGLSGRAAPLTGGG